MINGYIKLKKKIIYLFLSDADYSEMRVAARNQLIAITWHKYQERMSRYTNNKTQTQIILFL